MSDDATGFVGSIPENYDRGLGPILFADYADYTAGLVAGYAPSRVLETGAGTGIVTRRLRDLLPATTRLIARFVTSGLLGRGRAKESSECLRPVAGLSGQQFPLSQRVTASSGLKLKGAPAAQRSNGVKGHLAAGRVRPLPTAEFRQSRVPRPCAQARWPRPFSQQRSDQAAPNGTGKHFCHVAPRRAGEANQRLRDQLDRHPR